MFGDMGVDGTIMLRCIFSVRIEAGHGLDVRGSIPGKSNDGIFSLHHVQIGSGTQCVPGVKMPVREANLSPPSSAEDKNEWSYTSTPPIHVHGVVLS
jgi:hypothetical protein